MLHTWLISHLSTTRFECSLPLFCSHSGRWFLDSIHSWCCCVAGPDWFIQYSLVRLVQNDTTEPSSLAIPFGVYPSSSRVYITQLYVCVCAVCEGKWICVNMRVFRLLLTHLIHHVFASNLWAYRCRRCYFFIVCATLLMCIRSISCG